MISNRVQIKDALLTICNNVKTERPEGELTLPLITYGEVTNVHVGQYEDRIEYQIDAHASSFPEIIQLTQQIDSVMADMGWTRTYVTPDSNARVGVGLYHKSMSYVARIDVRYNDIIGGF